MANPKHLKILKKGVEAWNEWREEIKDKPDLGRADLCGADLSYADFRGTNLRGANLSGSKLCEADFCGADLQDAILITSNLSSADLIDTNLAGAGFIVADLSNADLTGADLSGAYLGGAKLIRTNLRGAVLAGAQMVTTILVDLDLSETVGLDQVQHGGPSSIGTDTLYKSRGKIPGVFLRGCGLSDWEITSAKMFDPTLSSDQIADLTFEIAHIKVESPIQINRVFISYARTDSAFVDALEPLLDRKRIRYWRDIHHLKAGRIETQIDLAIHRYPIVLLVLSEGSVESDWVEWEVSKARELEKQEKRDVLCPVALDDAWRTCTWPGPLRRQIEDYNILDFSEWKNDAAMKRQFQKLIDGLGMFYPTAR